MKPFIKIHYISHILPFGKIYHQYHTSVKFGDSFISAGLNFDQALNHIARHIFGRRSL